MCLAADRCSGRRDSVTRPNHAIRQSALIADLERRWAPQNHVRREFVERETDHRSHPDNGSRPRPRRFIGESRARSIISRFEPNHARRSIGCTKRSRRSALSSSPRPGSIQNMRLRVTSPSISKTRTAPSTRSSRMTRRGERVAPSPDRFCSERNSHAPAPRPCFRRSP